MNLKKRINALLVCSLLTAPFIIQSMDRPEDSKQKDKKPSKTKRFQDWVAVAGNIILGNAPMSAIQQLAQEKTRATQATTIVQHMQAPVAQKELFINLPPEMKFDIITALKTTSDPSSLTEAAKALRILMQVNKQLNDWINNPDFCFALMKRFKQLFTTNDETICESLLIPRIKERLDLQNSFVNNICKAGVLDLSKFNHYISSGVDLYFTDSNNQTPAELCISLNKSDALKALLDAGFNPEYIGYDGFSLYQQASIAATMNQSKDSEIILDILKQAMAQNKSKDY